MRWAVVVSVFGSGPLWFAGIAAAAVTTVPVRIATYNIDADTGSTTVNDSAITTVLGGIGNYNGDGRVRPVDILALQETTSNATTVAPIVADLNTLYGTTAYTVPSLQPGEYNNSPTVGNGPSSLIYNSATMKLVEAVTVGSASGSSNGVYRQIARYEFQPVATAGGTAAGAFYVYVEHAKSGSTASDLTARGKEAAVVRADADALPTNSRVIYVGDFNIGSSSEASITNMEAAGAGQANDPLNMPGDYASNSAFKGILTESSTSLRYRDDLQLVTNNVLGDSTGVQYTTGSYAAFGNNGTTAIGGSTSASSNTALPGLSNRTAVLSALTQVTDHLPLVADYDDVIGPTLANWNLTTGGTWGTIGNWSTTIVPTGAGSAVTFGNTLSTAGTVTIDGSRTVGRITFAAAKGYTLTAGTGGTVTLNDTGDLNGLAPGITVTAGSHTIAAPLALTAGATVTTASGSGLTINGAVTGGGSLTTAGAGTLTIGTAGTISVPLVANSAVTFAPNTTSTTLVRTLGGLTIGSGATVTVGSSATGRTLLVAPSLSVAGTLDLTTNDLDVPNGSLSAVTALVASGYAAGKWTGTGLTSSTAAADPSHLMAVGVIQNNTSSGTPLYTTFDGRSVTTSDVLARYTLYGDTNLDGVVDAADYTRIDAGFISGGKLTGWANGDFNDDGVINGTDYTLMDNAFNMQSGNVGSPDLLAAQLISSFASVTSVPEPAMLVLLPFGLMLGRRRLKQGRPAAQV